MALPFKNQMVLYNNNDNLENSINKYSLKLFEKLNGSNTKNRLIKPYDFSINKNNNINLFAKQMSRDLIKPMKITKNKSKDNKEDNSNKNIKFQKQIKIETNLDFKKNNNNNNSSSSSYTNTNKKTKKLDFNSIRKYSDNTRDYNNEFKKEKNIKDSRNFSNVNNCHQIDLNKQDNKENPIISGNSLNILKMKNTNINNNSNNKYTIDLKNHNKIIDNINNIVNINTISGKEIDTSNNKTEKEKKFSIVDIPSPSASNNNNNNNLININDKKTLPKNINLTLKEKAYYILSKSPIVPLSSQFIFSRSSPNIKKLISKEEILKNYELYLNNKIKDYENKIKSYNEKITSIFTPTKIAEITLNFITKTQEIEFCDIYNQLKHDKKDYNFIYYNNYIKIIYFIINENIEENISDDKLLSNLYKILEKKGYYNIKDYLYFLFISSKNTKKDNCFIKNIDKIEEIITNKVPQILSFEESMKMCRFVVFSLYLIKEIIDFGNAIKNTTKLQIDTNIFINELKDCLNKFKNKYIK